MTKLKVNGVCPACGSESLYPAAVGKTVYRDIMCSNADCPDPSAASKILSESEIHHTVLINDKSFSLKHPLRERIGNELLSCPVYKMLTSLDGPPAQTGTYRVRVVGDELLFELPEVAA